MCEELDPLLSVVDTDEIQQVYEMSLPCGEGGVTSFFETFYGDDSVWGSLQHKERGDSHIEVEKWTSTHRKACGTSIVCRARSRRFRSPFKTTIVSGVAEVDEEQYAKTTDDGTQMAIVTSVSMRGDVPYCECYKVNTVLHVLLDDEDAEDEVYTVTAIHSADTLSPLKHAGAQGRRAAPACARTSVHGPKILQVDTPRGAHTLYDHSPWRYGASQS